MDALANHLSLMRALFEDFGIDMDKFLAGDKAAGERTELAALFLIRMLVDWRLAMKDIEGR